MLRVQDIRFKVGHKVILDGIKGSFKKGQLSAIIGPNGAGKSTLLKTISEEISAQSGEVYWEQKELNKLSPQEQSKIRAVFGQENQVTIDFTVEEIVSMGRFPFTAHKDMIHNASIIEEQLALCGIAHLRKAKYQKLSGGEKQRVHLARVFAQVAKSNEPTFILLDEPLNNLDIRHQFEILELTKTYVSKGNTAVLVIHDLNLAARFADHILLLDQGEVVAQGEPKEVYQEKILSDLYHIDVQIAQHPFEDCPVVYFKTNSNGNSRAGVVEREIRQVERAGA